MSALLEIMDKKTLLSLLEKMILIRKFEEAVIKGLESGKIRGAAHLYVGEEAVAVGVCSNLKKEDWISSTHRGHGHCIAKGVDPRYMMAELYGKKSGACKGKGGSMHIADVSLGMLGANGIIGGGIPIATGAAFTQKFKGTKNVAVCFFGDGAVNQGTFHESLNLASYAYTFPCSKAIKIRSISERAQSYDIPGVAVDGMDVLAVYEASKKAVDNAREGRGPTLIECKTYRFRGHFEGDDDQAYRTQQEVLKWKNRDPIANFKTRLVSRHVLTEREFKAIDETASHKIEGAVRYADESPFPDPSEVLEDVYAS